MINQTYIPVALKFKENLAGTFDLQKRLIEGGYSPGLMLVILGGIKAVTEEKELLYHHLSEFQEDLKDYPLITMLSCLPCEEMDLLNQRETSLNHVKRGIEFARGLPVGGNRLLTFHLGSLVSKEEFLSRSRNQWRTKFYDSVMPALKEISRFAVNHGVEVKVESIPTPSFGDISFSDEREYRGVRLNQLRDPFYLTHHWGFDEIRESGLDLCLDICHNRTIYLTAMESETESVLHEEDLDILKTRSLFDDVLALGSADLVHLNDGVGIFSEIKRTTFHEGVALGEGDIADLKRIIDHFDARQIHYVLELNETNYIIRPNTRKSIEFLLNPP